MPKVLIKEIRGYIGAKEYFCPNCGEELGLNAHIDHLLMDSDLEKIQAFFLYCNRCGEKIE